MNKEALLKWDDLFTALFTDTQHNIELRALPSKKRLFTKWSDKEAIEKFIKENLGQDLYFGVGTREGEKGTKEAVKEATIRKMILSGRLPVVRIGRTVTIPEDYIDKMIRDGYQPALKGKV